MTSDPENTPTVVLVHGAFADASSWSRVMPRLLDAGASAQAIVNPLRGLTADGQYVANFLAQIDGPIVLTSTPHSSPPCSPLTFPPRKPKVLAYSQRPASGIGFGEPLAVTPGWKRAPSWFIVGGADHAVNPDSERAAAQRMGATMSEIEGTTRRGGASAYPAQPTFCGRSIIPTSTDCWSATADGRPTSTSGGSAICSAPSYLSVETRPIQASGNEGSSHQTNCSN